MQNDSQQPLEEVNSPSSQSVTAQPQQQPPHVSRKRLWITLGSIFAAVILLGGGGVFAYMAYQNPDKVIADAFSNAVKANATKVNGTVAFKSKAVDTMLTITSRSDQKDMATEVDLTLNLKSMKLDTPLNLKASSVIVDGKALYFKIEKMQSVFDSYKKIILSQVQHDDQESAVPVTEMAEYEKQLNDTLKPFVDKYDNKWVKVSLEDIMPKEDKEVQTCVEEVVQKLRTDKATQNEFKKLYSDNRFAVVEKKLGLKNGNYGYELKFDTDKIKSFTEGVADTSFGESLKKCDKSYDFKELADNMKSSTDSASADDSTTKLELWISQWDHHLKSAELRVASEKAASSLDADMNVEFVNAIDPVEAPTDSIPVQELIDEIKSLFQSSDEYELDQDVEVEAY